MKKKYLLMLIITICAIVIIALLLKLFVKKEETPMEFEKIVYSSFGSMAGKSVYELTKTENGMLIEYYYENEYYSDKISDYVTEKNMYRQEEVDSSLYVKMCQALTDSKALKWDGYSGSNSDVLDGGGFSLDIVLTNGETISCNGYNAAPKNFRIFSECINEIVTVKDLTETTFSTNSYELEVPTSWLNEVKVHYSDDCNSFFITVDDTRVYLFNMYENNYGYYDGDQYLKLDTQDKEDYYAFCSKGSSINSYVTKMSDSQKAIVESLDKDIETIANSYKMITK